MVNLKKYFKQKMKLSFDQIKSRAANFKRRVDFKRGDDSCYKSAVRQGFIEMLFPKQIKPAKPPRQPRPPKPPRVTRKLSHDLVKQIAANYTSRHHFEVADKSACNYARKHNLLIDLFPEKKYAAGTTESFVEKAKLIHGDKYDYSLVSYTRHKVKVPIICREHGEFWQRPASHLGGRGCAKCWAFDNNAFYMKRALNCFFNGNPVYKVGVTSARLGTDRVVRQNKLSGIDHELVIHPTQVVGSATDIEVFALGLGQNPMFVGFDGCTEYRAYTDEDVNAIKMMVELCEGVVERSAYRRLESVSKQKRCALKREVNSMFLAGASRREIASRLSLTYSRVSRWLSQPLT